MATDEKAAIVRELGLFSSAPSPRRSVAPLVPTINGPRWGARGLDISILDLQC